MRISIKFYVRMLCPHPTLNLKVEVLNLNLDVLDLNREASNLNAARLGRTLMVLFWFFGPFPPVNCPPINLLGSDPHFLHLISGLFTKVHKSEKGQG